MLSLVFPPACVLCEAPGSALCVHCALRLEPPSLIGVPEGMDAFEAICAYRGAGRDLVLAFKRRNRRAVAVLLGHVLAARIDEAWRTAGPAGRAGGCGDLRAPDSCAVTWAPTSNSRRRRRGYDQSEVLAAAVANASGLPAVRLLEHTGRAQHGRSMAERRRGPEFALTRTPPSSVVLVDDVVTTGATMSGAATALRTGGTTTVVGLAVARCA